MSVSTVRRRLAAGRLEGRREERVRGFRWLVFVPDDRPAPVSLETSAPAPAGPVPRSTEAGEPSTGGSDGSVGDGAHEGALRTRRDHAVMTVVSVALLALAAALYVLPLAGWTDGVAIAIAVVAVPIAGNEMYHLARHRPPAQDREDAISRGSR